MASTSVIAGFLIKLGFQIDKEGMNKFNGNVSHTVKQFKSLTSTASKVGTALSAVFMKSIYDIDKTNKSTTLLNTSVGKFGILTQAFKRAGGDVGTLTGAMGQLNDNFKRFPNFRDWVKDNLGIDVVDANGKLRNMSDVFMDLRNKLVEINNTDPNLARQTAEALGLGEAFDIIIRKNFDQELRNVGTASTSLSQYLDDNANSATALSNTFSQLKDTATNALQALVLELSNALGLEEKLKKFTKTVQDNATTWIGTVKTFVTGKNPEGKEVDRTKIAKDYLPDWMVDSANEITTGKDKDGKEVSRWKSFADFGRKMMLSRFRAGFNLLTPDDAFVEQKKWLTEQIDGKTNNKDEWKKHTKTGMLNSVAQYSDLLTPTGFDNPIKDVLKDMLDKEYDKQAEADRKRSYTEQMVFAPARKETERLRKEAEKLVEHLQGNRSVYQSGNSSSSSSSSNSSTPSSGSVWDTRGFKNFNPGNLVALPNDRREGGLDGRFAVFDSMNEGVYRMARQLKMYANAASANSHNIESLIATYAPQEDNNDPASYAKQVAQQMSQILGVDIGTRTELDLSNPYQLRALVMSMIDRENGAGASQALKMDSTDIFMPEIVKASQSTAVSRAYNKSREVASTNNVNINQTINIDGAKDPKAVAETVTRETKEALYRNVNQNMM